MKTLDEIAQALQSGKLGLDLLNKYYRSLNKVEIGNLMDITILHVPIGLAKKVGVNRGDVKKFRKKLGELNTLSERIYDYEVSEQCRIIDRIVEEISSPSISHYMKETEGSVLEDNRRAVVSSPQFKTYLSSKKIRNLEEVTIQLTHTGVIGIFGTKRGRSIDLRNAFAQYDVFSRIISDTEQERIVKSIIKRKMKNPKYRSSYFFGVDAQTLKHNRSTFLASNAFSAFLIDEEISLTDPNTLNTRAKKLFTHYLGWNLRVTKNRGERLYRRLVTVWGEGEKEKLKEYAQGKTVDEFSKLLREERARLQEEFGRSYSSITSQAILLGLLSGGGRSRRRSSSSVEYDFPQVHTKEFEDISWHFTNSAILIENGVRPICIPAFGFESAVHAQFTHVSVPIFYGGVTLERYNDFEQQILVTLAQYISERERFPLCIDNQNDLSAPLVMDTEPSILKMQNPFDRQMPFIQLIYRRSANPYKTDMQPIRTEAIRLGQTQIYHFTPKGSLAYEDTTMA